MIPAYSNILFSRLRTVCFAGIISFSFVLSACSINAQSSPPSKEEFTDCSGVYAFRNTGNEKEGDAVKIYDKEGHIWYRSPYHVQGFDSQGDAGPNKIKPLVLFAGDYTPVFRCVSYSRNWYAVIVVEDERDPVIKFMLRSDPLFDWQSWDTYYLDNWIRFDPEENPLRASINSADIIGFPGQDVPVHASKLDGDWMKLEWTTPNGEKRNGWIKWRDESTNRIMVSFPYK